MAGKNTEVQLAEEAGSEIGEAFNLLHWAVMAKATGADFAERAKLASTHLEKALAILDGAQVAS